MPVELQDTVQKALGFLLDKNPINLLQQILRHITGVEERRATLCTCDRKVMKSAVTQVPIAAKRNSRRAALIFSKSRYLSICCWRSAVSISVWPFKVFNRSVYMN